MPEQDQWDITTGVGVTALAVAAARSLETHRADGLVEDPYAESFVRAAGMPFDLPTRPEDLVEIPEGPVGTVSELLRLMSTYVGVRSRFFDEYFRQAMADGVEQAVLLAAGLDTRAFRLDWPDAGVVFEIDQPKVLEFKDRVLAEQGAKARCDRRVVGVDLREDWVGALREAGFDPAKRTAWLAEGLLPYLPADAERDLFSKIGGLSAAGSQLAAEKVNEASRRFFDDPDLRRAGTDLGVDVAGLVHDHEKDHEPADLLTADGWTVSEVSPADTSSDYGRPLSDEPKVAELVGSTAFLVARR